MAGKRMIDENICIDKRLNAVKEGAENLFYRLLVKTDDNGNVFAEPDLIKGQLYPRRLDISLEEIQARLDELHNATGGNGFGLIIIYEKNREKYAHLPGFFKYQRLRTDIKPKVIYPIPTKEDLERIRNKSLPQVSKDKKDKEVSKEEIVNFKILYKNAESLKMHLTTRGFDEECIAKVLKKVFPKGEKLSL